MTTKYKLTVIGIDTNDESIIKSFPEISNNITVSLGTQFSNAYLALTTLRGDKMIITKLDTVDLS